MRISLREATTAMQARVDGAGPDVEVSSYSIDTRTLEPGALFFAIAGATNDGHDFVPAAFRRGAAAAVVHREVEGSGPRLVVADTLAALQALARHARARWAAAGAHRRIIGITGSAGKTTTKEAVYAVLAGALRTGKTIGNFNNHLGVPLSLLHLPEDADAAVLEVGMNHAGEIRHLAAIAQPQIALVTNVGTAHVENFEDGIEGIARAKRELVEALPADGIAVLNADDPRVAAFAGIHPGRTIFYGLSERAEVRARDIEYRETGVRFRLEGVGTVEAPLHGPAGVLTSCAALAAARALGLDLRSLRQSLPAMTPPPMRAERSLHRGMTIWNDCYNSNPEAARMMVDLLAATPAARRIAVLGEMLELGRWSKDLHEDVGRHVAQCRISVLVGIRGAARQLADAAKAAGLAADAAYFFEDPSEAGVFLRSLARPGDALLFKGSRGTRVELALQAFTAEN